jgi:hypothetical protein
MCSLEFRFSKRNCLFMPHLSHVCYTSCPFNSASCSRVLSLQALHSESQKSFTLTDIKSLYNKIYMVVRGTIVKACVDRAQHAFFTCRTNSALDGFSSKSLFSRKTSCLEERLETCVLYLCSIVCYDYMSQVEWSP